MSEIWSGLHGYLASEEVRVALRVAVILLGGLFVARLIRRRLSFGNLSPQHQLGLRRFGSYVVLVLTAAWALQVAGIELSMLLGAAGILTVAVGFAAQTSASNLISGLFLMGERPFVVGDLITVDNTTGYVLTIDLMSVKLRTFDNLMVRIPNETMLKSNVINLSHFPIRRVDLQIGVAYKEDVGHVRDLLFATADRNPLCLEEPKPQFFFKAYGDSALELQLSAWTAQENYFALKTSLLQEIKESFDQAGVEIPFPHLSLYAGSVTEPMPVRVQAARPE
jgi:small-conductance mechanosensitive channel